jgi:exonuclease 3'-5' domain-containing protein 2
MPVVGLDMEWRPKFIRGSSMIDYRIALVQVASQEKILLFQICSIGSVPQSLAELLADPNILKVGVSIANDIKKLGQDWGLHTISSCLDLGRLAKSQESHRWQSKSSGISLIKLFEAYLGMTLDKPKQIQLSNWQRAPLDLGQIDCKFLSPFGPLNLQPKLLWHKDRASCLL